MKTVLGIVLLLSAFLFAQGAPTANSNGYAYHYEVDRTIGVAGWDTLSGADSTTLLASTTSLSEDWEYILRVGVTTGSGSDSVFLIVRADYYNNTTFLYSVNCDTVATATGEAIILPFNRSGYANKVGLKYVSTSANGGVVALGNTSLLKRKYIR